MFSPILDPFNTGCPPWAVSRCPDPSFLKLTQNTAFPGIGRTASPLWYVQSSHLHHGSLSFHAGWRTIGNHVDPPSMSSDASSVAKKLVMRSIGRGVA